MSPMSLAASPMPPEPMDQRNISESKAVAEVRDRGAEDTGETVDGGMLVSGVVSRGLPGLAGHILHAALTLTQLAGEQAGDCRRQNGYRVHQLPGQVVGVVAVLRGPAL